jgi:hypothetical protein
MDEFRAEGETRSAPASASTSPAVRRSPRASAAPTRSSGRLSWLAGLTLVPGILVALAVRTALSAGSVAQPVPMPTGTIVVDSQPGGLEVRVDGKAAGTTPARVMVPSGTRVVQVSYRGTDRSVGVPVDAGETVRQRFEFVLDTAAALGESPAPIVAEPPAPARSIPSATTPRAPSSPPSGWLRIQSPSVLRIFEGGALVGSSDVERLLLPAGEHALELRSDELGFSTHQVVTVKAGDTVVVPIRLPQVPISVNARPWAQVWVNGELVGDTPIGTLLRPIGRHELVLRHPELGERRHSLLVTTGGAARVAIDFTAAP